MSTIKITGAHQNGRSQVENLFARRITPNLQLLCWDRPSDPTALAYQVWASDSLNEKRPELSILNEHHLYVEAFPDFGDGRHYLLVHHDLPAVYEVITHVRAINKEHHSDPATHSHFAADHEVNVDAKMRVDGRDEPPLIVTLKGYDGTEIELSRETGLSEMMIPHHGSIEEIASLNSLQHYSLALSEGGKTPITRRTVVRTAKRQSGGNFRGNRIPPDRIPVRILRRPEIIPQARLYRDAAGQLSITPHVQIMIEAGSRPLPGVGTGFSVVVPAPDGERIETLAKVVAHRTSRSGAPEAEVALEGQAASAMHAQLLAADRQKGSRVGVPV